MFSPRLALGLSLVSLLAFIGVNAFLFSHRGSPPNIQGVIVPEGRAIDSFLLLNHKRENFDNQKLKGYWSLISYGFTDCPDICPTTLNKLAVVMKQLEEMERFHKDLQVLFYTVDPQRDTADHLARYVSFFHPDFVGLTYGPELATEHVPFESSLGMVSAIRAVSKENLKHDFKGYEVSHGVMLYLVNPQGRLQAIFKPKKNAHGLHFFDVETVKRDYIAVREYFG